MIGCLNFLVAKKRSQAVAKQSACPVITIIIPLPKISSEDNQSTT